MWNLSRTCPHPVESPLICSVHGRAAQAGDGPVTYFLERSLLIPRPREEVFAFFADALNLERITPPFLRFHILTPPPIAMHTGTLIDYELRLYGVKFKWKTRIEGFQPPHFFVDAQLKGPYRQWVHRHTFEEVQGGTLMRDRVEYALSLGPLGALAHALMVRRSVEKIFAFRNQTIAGIFGA
jgi:ligand-binding SRPBCC domain-containing protein